MQDLILLVKMLSFSIKMLSFSIGDGFGDNVPESYVSESAKEAVKNVLKDRKEAEKHAALRPWDSRQSDCRNTLAQLWSSWVESQSVQISKHGYPMPWRGGSAGSIFEWSTIFLNAQVSRRLDEDGHKHWFPSGCCVLKNSDGSRYTRFSDISTNYIEYMKSTLNFGMNAKRTQLHVTCPSWCPKCGGCGTRSTFPGCGREPLPEPEEKLLRAVIEQLFEMRRLIQLLAKKKAHIKLRRDQSKKACEKCLKKSEPGFELLVKALNDAQKEYTDACAKFEAEVKKYKIVLNKNESVFKDIDFKRFTFPRNSPPLSALAYISLPEPECDPEPENSD
jgi:hypothetical protein